MGRAVAPRSSQPSKPDVVAEFRASAPGKLVIAGEYAVLDGAPAISAAVNKRAVATVMTSPAGELSISNTGSRYAYALRADGRIDWRGDPGEFGAVMNALAYVMYQRESSRALLQPWRVNLCSRDFFAELPDSSKPKLGIGSSAAICVALTAAVQSSSNQSPDFAFCMDVHRELQRGAGSGIDVATSWHGGVLLMQPVDGGEPTIQPLRWPTGLYIRPVWTGMAAATTLMLQRLAGFRARSAGEYAKLMRPLFAALDSIRRSWQLDDAAALITGLSHYGELLAALDRQAAVGIWSDRHSKFGALATAMNVGYKPSGAGGGDFGLVFSQDADAVNAFVHAVHSRLVPQTHGLEWAANGLLINRETADG